MSTNTFGKLLNLTPKDKFSPIIARNNLFSAIYMALLLSFFYVNENYDQLGSCDSLKIVAVLIGLEIAKFSFFLTKKSNMEFRSRKRNIRLDKLWKGALFVVEMLIIFYVSAVLLGASMLSKFEQTFMLSCNLTALGVIPVVLFLEVDNLFSLLDLMTQTHKDSLSNMIVLQFQITLLGSWLGAVPIPLDWNREWQNWPNSCVLGAFFGYFIANVISLFLQTTNFINAKVPSFRCML